VPLLPNSVVAKGGVKKLSDCGTPVEAVTVKLSLNKIVLSVSVRAVLSVQTTARRPVLACVASK
jgi:hypothetical protein